MAIICGGLLQRFLLTILLCLSFLAISSTRVGAAEGIKKIQLGLTGLVYDPFTEKFYGTQGSKLLQIDPDSGAVLKETEMGRLIQAIDLGAGKGIWVSFYQPGGVRRFNLESLTPEDEIPLPHYPIYSISASQTESHTLAYLAPGGVRVVKHGALLPNTVFTTFPELHGSFLYGIHPYSDHTPRIEKFAVGPDGPAGEVSLVGYASVFGQLKAHGSYLFNGAGQVINTADLSLVKTLPVSGNPASAVFAFEAAENAVYYVSRNSTSWAIDRFNLATLTLIDQVDLPEAEVGTAAIRNIAVGSKKIGFHSDSHLFLVNTILPEFADVEVTQHTTRPATFPVVFGSDAAVEYQVRNIGPGPAKNLVVKASISPGFIRKVPTVSNYALTSPKANEFHIQIGSLAAGDSITFSLDLQPTKTGVATSILSAELSNDPEPGDNTSTLILPVAANQNQLVSDFAFQAKDMVYDPQTRRLFFAHDETGLWSVDMTGKEIYPPESITTVPGSIATIKTSHTGGWVFVHRSWGDLHRINATTGALEFFLDAGKSVVDFAPSPLDPDVVAVSGANGTYLYRRTLKLQNGSAITGDVEFSEDGQRIFILNPENCTLNVHRVDQNGLTFEYSENSQSCTWFTHLNGLIYFDSGAIFNPTSRQWTTPALNFTPPSFVVPRSNGNLDVLRKKDGKWVVQRLAAGTYQELATVDLGEISNPFEFVAAGENAVAIRSPFSLMKVVDLDVLKLLRSRILINDQRQPVLGIFTASGTNYRIEHATQLPATNWSTLRENVQGTGDWIDIPLSELGGTPGYYRVVRM